MNDSKRKLAGHYEVTEAFRRQVSGETACNYVVWEIQPGLYPVYWVRLGENPRYWGIVDFGQQPEVESFTMNRVFTATSSHHETHEVGEKLSHCVGYQFYGYQLEKLAAFRPIEEV